MVAGDVGEARRRQVHAVEPALVEPVARGLHRRVGHALVGELGQQPVQRDRLGRGVRRAAPPPRPRRPTVPKFTAVSPSASQICRVKLATEVLPLVPVTATITSGWPPNQRLAAIASARRGLSLRTTGTASGPARPRRRASPAGSVSTATAPIRERVRDEVRAVRPAARQRREEMPGPRARGCRPTRPVISGSGPDQSPARRVPVEQPQRLEPRQLVGPFRAGHRHPRVPGALRAIGLFVSGQRVKQRRAVVRARPRAAAP